MHEKGNAAHDLRSVVSVFMVKQEKEKASEPLSIFIDNTSFELAISCLSHTPQTTDNRNMSKPQDKSCNLVRRFPVYQI